MTLDEIQEMRRRELEQDLLKLLGTDWGRRVLAWFIYDLCGIERLSFYDDPADRYATAAIKDGFCAALHMGRREGRRAVAVELGRHIEAVDFNLVSRMLTERIHAAQADHARMTTTRSAGGSP